MSPKRKLAGPVTPGKRQGPVQLEYERSQEARAARIEAAAAAARPIRLRVAARAPPPLAAGQGLVLMALDIVEEAQGRFHVWGTSAQGASVLLRLTGFQPYFYVAAPKGQAEDGEAPDSQAADTDIEWDADQLERLRRLLNRHMPSDSRIAEVEALRRTPIMFYRPDTPGGGAYLRLVLGPGASAKRGAAAFEKAVASGRLRNEGLSWRDATTFEAEVQPLQRLLVDVPLSGGAWLYVPAGSGARPMGRDGWRTVPPADRVSSCDVEVTAPCQAVCCLTPDATQLADPAWSPFPGCLPEGGAGAAAVPPAAAEAAAAAKRGDIARLRMCVMDVVCATADGADRVAVPGRGDPVVSVTASFLPFAAAGHSGESPAAAQQAARPLGADGGQGSSGGDGGLEGEEEGPAVVASLAAVAGGPTGAGPRRSSAIPAAVPTAPAAGSLPAQETLVFLLHPAAAASRAEVAERSVAVGSGGGAARVLLFASEAELLLTWAACVRQADPDVIALFEVNDTLAVLQQRFAALGLEGGALQLSRLLPHCARSLSLKKVTMYSAQWVRSQSRMSSTSNQETWRADLDGRIVVDVLRQVLTAQNLASFSLVDCVQSLLGQTIEVLRPGRLAALAGLAGEAQQPLHTSHLPRADAAAADALRIARYALRRADAVASLMHRLATLPEMVEMARAVGLTLQQAAYNAQMIRTYSLLLRAARRLGFLVPGRQEAGQLQEHTFILHPVEEGTVGLYRRPVAILDFASLYPSLYRAHNLCYSTLLHRDDAGRLPPEQLTVTPTGAAFVKPGVRPGILPGILAALISARAATREQLKAAADPAARAVLDSRQKALKVTANALYGFTGAAASPLQCIQLADSCLAYGAQSCRRAKEVLEEAAAVGQLAPYGSGARVIYGHTDSLFMLLPQADDSQQAIAAGRLASKVVSAAFPPPMELKFERVCQPFMLLHVNRYAGRAFEREEDVARGGELICKGVKSMWRQTAPILRTTLHGALERILMRDDLRGALAFVAGEVRRLLSGRVELHELVMTGGLWRLTGEQVESAAAEAGPSAEDVRGPHASLAVRLSQRDPGRSFVLGERLQYVLLAGEQKQDDAAEDPLTAARAGQEGDYSLYWKNKLLKPLQEVFKAAAPPTQQAAVLAELLGGDHTRVRVDSVGPPPPALGPASPPPRGRGRGGGGGGSGTPARQARMGLFFRPVAKCLGCRASMPGHTGPLDDAPGLCDSCAGKEGRWEETYLGLLGDQAAAEARQSAAHAACTACHNGGAAGPVLCENGECPVTFTRLGCSSRVQQVDRQLRRLDIF